MFYQENRYGMIFQRYASSNFTQHSLNRRKNCKYNILTRTISSHSNNGFYTSDALAVNKYVFSYYLIISSDIVRLNYPARRSIRRTYKFVLIGESTAQTTRVIINIHSINLNAARALGAGVSRFSTNAHIGPGNPRYSLKCLDCVASHH